MSPRYTITHFDDVPARSCPCGTTRRAFAEEPDRIATFHRLEVKADAELHYHKRLTEMYYVLEGTGRMELDGESFDIRPGSVVQIKPGCRHRAVGRLTVLVVAVPAFDPDDEWFDDG